jgi:hypothetical protein
MLRRALISATGFFLLLSLSLSGCGGDVATYTDSEIGFSFQYRDSWKLMVTPEDELQGDAAASVGVYDPYGSDDGDDLTFDYFSVDVYETLTETLPTTDELREGFTDYLGRLDESDPSFRVIDQPIDTRINGRPALMVTYTYEAGGMDVRCAEYRLLGAAGFVYSLRTQSSEQNWKANKETFSIFLDSFSVGVE